MKPIECPELSEFVYIAEENRNLFLTFLKLTLFFCSGINIISAFETFPGKVPKNLHLS